MRKPFCDGLSAFQSRGDFVFLTGDLGYGALEPLRDAMGERFINAGVAEQNMISVAAGMARQGFRPWVYSIAPFLYARPFEQIRNDVCLHELPVVLVGNGGGYGYGVMGGTHHALEDYGVLLTLAGMQAYIPAFDSDLSHLIATLFKVKHPSYLRLGVAELPHEITAPPFAQWRKLNCGGGGGTLITVGPLVGPVWTQCRELPEIERPNLWCLSQLPVTEIPTELQQDITTTGSLVIAEEHVAQGSAGLMIAMELVRTGSTPSRIRHLTALGYPSGRYGSQAFHRRECGLDAPSILTALKELTASQSR